MRRPLPYAGTEEDRASGDLAVPLILAAGLLARLVFIFANFNRDWEHDPFGHVTFAQSVFADLPESLSYGISVWAKPLFTFFFAALYRLMPPLWPDLVVTQVVNALFWTAAAWLTLRVARDYVKYRQTLLVLAVIAAFTFIAFRSSVSANTEPMGALTTALALWLWHRHRMMWACLSFGLVILARTDSVFCVSVFAAWAVLEPLLLHRANWLAIALARGMLFAAPLLVWNLVGFLATGSPLFVVSQGYPLTMGTEDSGGLLDYTLSFLALDTVLSVAFATGAYRLLRQPRAAAPLLVVSALMGIVYFAAMTAIWTLGAFASAGYVRYFVFAYPLYILVAGVGIDRLFARLIETGRGVTGCRRMALLLSAVVLLQLHWLGHGIVWIFTNNTQIPPSDFRRVAQLAAGWGGRAVYFDQPDLAYYLGHNRLYLDRHPLTAIGNPDVRGIFIYVSHWTEHFTPGVTLADFSHLPLIAKLSGPYGEIAYIFER